MKKNNMYIQPKHTRVEVSPKLHKKLTLEAMKRKISVKKLIEEKLKTK